MQESHWLVWREGKGVEWRSFIEARLAQHPAPCGLLQNERANFGIKTNRGKHGVDKKTLTWSAEHQRTPQAEMDGVDKPAQARRLVPHHSRTGSVLSFPFLALPFCPNRVLTAGLHLTGSTFYHRLTVKAMRESHRAVHTSVTRLLRWPTQRPSTKTNTDINGLVSQATSPTVLALPQLSWTPLASGTWQL